MTQHSTTQHPATRHTVDNRLVAALAAPNASTRLQAALAAGTHADAGLVDTLTERCGVEPDFFVRDMLTWALTRLPTEVTVERLIVELGAPNPQARSQALHTLSKIGDRRAWAAITSSLMDDDNDEVARSAWRAAVTLVPSGSEAALARTLTAQLGRGDIDVQRSLSRALVALGDAAVPALESVRAHAIATERLMLDPDTDFALEVESAKRVAALGDGA
uniref:HEAT repeat domain-containing protein n=1 Tax=Gordonia sp. B7-2 TaxID=3420932 RepID=UPI003D93F369